MPKKKTPKPIPPPLPENIEQDRVLRLTVEIPYYGRADTGVKLERAVRKELQLQFGSKTITTLIDVPPVKKSATKAKAAPKKAVAKKAGAYNSKPGGKPAKATLTKKAPPRTPSATKPPFAKKKEKT